MDLNRETSAALRNKLLAGCALVLLSWPAITSAEESKKGHQIAALVDAP